MAKTNASATQPTAQQTLLFAPVSQKMKKLAEVKATLTHIEQGYNEKITAIQTKRDEKTVLLRAEAATLEQEILGFCKENHAGWGDKKTLALPGGTISRRTTRAVDFVVDEADCIDKANALGWSHCVRTTVAPDKTAIGKLTMPEMAQIGAKVVLTTNYNYNLT